MSDVRETWNAERVRDLRTRLGITQRQLADELGVRQQTISEWETGAYQPRGASARMLRHVAEHGVPYDTARGSSEPEARARDGEEPQWEEG